MLNQTDQHFCRMISQTTEWEDKRISHLAREGRCRIISILVGVEAERTFHLSVGKRCKTIHNSVGERLGWNNISLVCGEDMKNNVSRGRVGDG